MHERARAKREREGVQIASALLQGLTDKQIASQEGIVLSRVKSGMRLLCRVHAVANRVALAVKLSKVE
jgi:DNA-binding NarL/FixJ family response regulator